MKHSLGWVKGKVRLKILGFLLHLESLNVMEEEKRGSGVAESISSRPFLSPRMRVVR